MRIPWPETVKSRARQAARVTVAAHMGARTLTAVGNRAADAIADTVLRTLAPIHPPTVSTIDELEALPIGSVIAYIGDEPDAPAVACRAVRGWQFLGDKETDRVYHSGELTPVREPLWVLYTP